jgi:hypothetical protein
MFLLLLLSLFFNIIVTFAPQGAFQQYQQPFPQQQFQPMPAGIKQPEAPPVWKDIAADNIRVSTTRFNWYERKKIVKASYFDYDDLSVMIDSLKHVLTLFSQKNIEIKKIVDQFFLDMNQSAVNYNSAVNDFQLFVANLSQYEQLLHQMQTGDLANRDKEFKKKAAQLEFDAVEIKLHMQNIINNMNLVRQLYGQIKNSIRIISDQITQAESFEQEAWAEYQKLDELISDSQAQQISRKIKNYVANVNQIDQYIRGKFVGFFNKTIGVITSGINSITNDFDQWIVIEKKFIQEYSDLIAQEEKDKKIKEEEAHRKELEAKAEEEKFEKNKIEAEKKKKIEAEQRALSMRPWYIKALSFTEKYVLKVYEYVSHISTHVKPIITLIIEYYTSLKDLIMSLFGSEKKKIPIKKSHIIAVKNNVINNEQVQPIETSISVAQPVEGSLSQDPLVVSNQQVSGIVAPRAPNSSVEIKTIPIQETVPAYENPQPQVSDVQKMPQQGVFHNTSEMAPHLSSTNPISIAQNTPIPQMVPNPYAPGSMIDAVQLQQIMNQQQNVYPGAIQSSENLDMQQQNQNYFQESYYQRYNQQNQQQLFQQSFSDQSQMQIQSKDDDSLIPSDDQLQNDFSSGLSSTGQLQNQQITTPSFGQIASARRVGNRPIGGLSYGQVNSYIPQQNSYFTGRDS